MEPDLLFFSQTKTACVLMVIYISVIDLCGGNSEAYFAR